MGKVTVFKTQRIGGKHTQIIESVAVVNDKAQRADKAASDDTRADWYTRWVARQDEEIGYWESIYPFWFKEELHDDGHQVN